MRLTQSYVVRMVQISHVFMMDYVFLPYAAGLLEAYVKAYAPNSARYTFLPPFYQTMPLDKALLEFQYVDIAAFSVYAWNEQYSLTLAKALKKRHPHMLIVCGGPQIPNAPQAYMQNHPYIDICVTGEGEPIFLDILEAHPQQKWEDIPSITYRKTDQIISNAQSERVKDIDRFPSPYLSGVFEPLLKAKVRHKWAAVWESNRGCPFSCSFCDWGGLVQAKVLRFDLDRVKKEALWFGNKEIGFVFNMDANFGMLKRDKDIAQAIIDVREKTGFPHFMIIQSTKNATDRSYEVLKMLYEADLCKFIPISLQSITPEALKHIRRENISLETYRILQARFQKNNIPTYTDFLIGLPGDSYDTFTDGVSQIVADGQHHCIRFYDVQILPNSEMGDPAYHAEHQLETIVTEYRIPLNNSHVLPESRIPEYQEMIIANRTLPREDWVRVKAHVWMYDVVYFNWKILQIPILLLHKTLGLSFREQIEAFLKLPNPQAPIFENMSRFMHNKAQEIQAGGSDVVERHQLMGFKMVYSIPEFITTGLYESNALDTFYHQAKHVLSQWIEKTYGPQQLPPWLSEAIDLNYALSYNHSYKKPVDLQLKYNIWESYQKALVGEDVEIKYQPAHYYCPQFRNFATSRQVDTLKVQIHTAKN